MASGAQDRLTQLLSSRILVQVTSDENEPYEPSSKPKRTLQHTGINVGVCAEGGAGQVQPFAFILMAEERACMCVCVCVLLILNAGLLCSYSTQLRLSGCHQRSQTFLCMPGVDLLNGNQDHAWLNVINLGIDRLKLTSWGFWSNSPARSPDCSFAILLGTFPRRQFEFQQWKRVRFHWGPARVTVSACGSQGVLFLLLFWGKFWSKLLIRGTQFCVYWLIPVKRNMIHASL